MSDRTRGARQIARQHTPHVVIIALLIEGYLLHSCKGVKIVAHWLEQFLFVCDLLFFELLVEMSQTEKKYIFVHVLLQKYFIIQCDPFKLYTPKHNDCCLLTELKKKKKQIDELNKTAKGKLCNVVSVGSSHFFQARKEMQVKCSIL